MKLSILPVSLFAEISSGKMSLGEWAAYAQSKGTDGYDASILFFPNSTPTTIEAMKKQINNRDVSISPVMVCCYPDFTNPDSAERERQLDYLRRDIALISDFGFRYVRVTAGQNHPGLEIHEAAKRCADCFAKMADVAERYGVRMVFENHSKPGAWPLIDFSFNQEAFLAVYEEIRDIPMGINFDTANAVACGANPEQLLKSVIDKVETIHLNDAATVGKWTPTPVGRGLVDFEAIFHVLKENNFDGWVCIEEASGQGLQGIDNAIEFARKYVNERGGIHEKRNLS